LSCMKMSQKNSNPSSQSGMLLAHVLEYFLGTYLCRHISEEVFEL
jgi:hypothetical protein